MSNPPFDRSFVWISISWLELFYFYLFEDSQSFFSSPQSNPLFALSSQTLPQALLSWSSNGITPPNWTLPLWQLHPSLSIRLSIQSCGFPDPKTFWSSPLFTNWNRMPHLSIQCLHHLAVQLALQNSLSPCQLSLIQGGGGKWHTALPRNLLQTQNPGPMLTRMYKLTRSQVTHMHIQFE